MPRTRFVGSVSSGGGGGTTVTKPPEIVLNAGPLTDAPPTGASIGLDTLSNTFYRVNAGVWEVVPTGSDQVVTNAGPLTGAAPAGALFGVDTTSNDLYKVDGAGDWELMPITPVTVETITQANTFAVGQIIQNNAGTGWALAQADDAATEGHIVVLSATAADFVISKTAGLVTITGHSFGAAGTPIFLSDAVAGGTVSTDDQTITVAIGRVLDTDTVYLFNSGLGFE